MKTNTTVRITNNTKGFTLIEVLIVGAIIALLAVLILNVAPGAIRKIRINTTIGSLAQLKTAITDYLNPDEGGFNTLPITEGAAGLNGDATAISNGVPALAAAARLDDVLLSTRSLDKATSFPLARRSTATGNVGVQWVAANQAFTATAGPDIDYSPTARAECRPTNPAAAPSAGTGNFRLNGVTDLTAGRRVAYVVMPNVQIDDAFQLSRAIDKDELSAPNNTTTDDRGHVVYAAPVAGDTTTVFVYVGMY